MLIENLSHDLRTTPEIINEVPAIGSLKLNVQITSDLIESSGLFGFSSPKSSLTISHELTVSIDCVDMITSVKK